MTCVTGLKNISLFVREMIQIQCIRTDVDTRPMHGILVNNMVLCMKPNSTHFIFIYFIFNLRKLLYICLYMLFTI